MPHTASSVPHSAPASIQLRFSYRSPAHGLHGSNPGHGCGWVWLWKNNLPPSHEHKLPFSTRSFQVLSPLAKNLFHRAISESGVALTSALVKKDSKAAAQVGLTLVCPHTFRSALLELSGPFRRVQSGWHPQKIIEVRSGWTGGTRTHLTPTPSSTTEQTGAESWSTRASPRSVSDEGRAGLRLMTLVCQPRALSTEHGSQSVPGGVLGLMGVIVCCLARGLGSSKLIYTLWAWSGFSLGTFDQDGYLRILHGFIDSCNRSFGDS